MSEYQAAGAEIVGSAHDVWRLAEMVVKVKEPVEKEYRHFREGLVLFTYLHLAPLTELTNALLEKKVTGIAYETVRDRTGGLPLLTPMSEVAGRLSVQIGATYLQKGHGGRGRAAWAGFRAWLRGTCASSAAALWAPTRRRWRWAWARR